MRGSLLALILCGTAVEAQPESSFVVDGFTNAAAFSSFEIEGISLETPMGKIPDILLSRGYEEVLSDKPGYLEFVKGTREPTRLGATSFQLKVLRDGAGRSIELSRTVRGERPFSTDNHIQEAKRLKALICKGVPDETQHWRLCPPDTDTKVTLGTGRQVIKLTSGLFVQALRVSTKGSAIHIEHK